MHVTIGCDPGNLGKSAVAAIVDEKGDGGRIVMVERVHVHGINWYERFAALRRICRACNLPVTRSGKLQGVDGVVMFGVEDQFVGQNPRSAASLIANATAWEVCASIMGMTLSEKVHPSTWQAVYGIAQGKTIERKQGAAEVVERHLKRKLPSSAGQSASAEDCNDAALLTIYLHAWRMGWNRDPDQPIPGWEWVRMERFERAMRRKQARAKAKARKKKNGKS